MSDLVRTVTITRTFDAPRELVFKAWIDPVHMARWWGPKGFTNPICDMDVRIGGIMRIVMRAPTGMEHPMTAEFREIEPPRKLVFNCTARDPHDKPLLESLTTVAFEDIGGKTTVTMHAQAVGLAPIAAQMLAGMEIGWTQSIDRLGELVEVMKEGAVEREIVSIRLFKFPRELVFKAWSLPESLGRWWGPTGFTTTFHEFSFQPGGVWRFIMHGPNGTDYPQEMVYRQIVPCERIVIDHISLPKFRLTATFEDLCGSTLLTFCQRFESREQRDKVAVLAIPANEQNFDKMEVVLKEILK